MDPSQKKEREQEKKERDEEKKEGEMEKKEEKEGEQEGEQKENQDSKKAAETQVRCPEQLQKPARHSDSLDFRRLHVATPSHAYSGEGKCSTCCIHTHIAAKEH